MYGGRNKMNEIEKHMLEQVSDLHDIPAGAYNLRENGKLAGRNSTANIEITTKTDNPGIDIRVKPGTKNESMHIPVILTESGLTDLVYNDFFIGEDADVLIVAGCGIHNDGSDKTQHDGVHTFHVSQRARAVCREALRRGKRHRRQSSQPADDRDSREGRVNGDGNGTAQGS